MFRPARLQHQPGVKEGFSARSKTSSRPPSPSRARVRRSKSRLPGRPQHRRDPRACRTRVDGPVSRRLLLRAGDDVAGYLGDYLPFNTRDPRKMALCRPGSGSTRSDAEPTCSRGPRGVPNYLGSLEDMKAKSKNPATAPRLSGRGHFNVHRLSTRSRPMILKDEGPKASINFTTADKLALSPPQSPATSPIDRMKAEREAVRVGATRRPARSSHRQSRPGTRQGFPRRPGIGRGPFGRP